jgi:hypothetical protein
VQHQNALVLERLHRRSVSSAVSRPRRSPPHQRDRSSGASRTASRRRAAAAARRVRAPSTPTPSDTRGTRFDAHEAGRQGLVSTSYCPGLTRRLSAPGLRTALTTHRAERPHMIKFGREDFSVRRLASERAPGHCESPPAPHSG